MRRPSTLTRWTHFFTHHGLPLLFVVVMLESFGIPLPGETALIFFGVLASKGHYNIAVVIAVAAAAAIIGDNLGYWLIGRLGGRALFRANRWLKRWSDSRAPAGRSDHAAPRRQDGVLRPLRRDSPLHRRVGRRPRPDAVVAVPLLERDRRDRLGDRRRRSSRTTAARPPRTRSQRYGLFAAAGIAAVVVLGVIGPALRQEAARRTPLNR